MSSSEDDTASPELGAGGTTHLVSPMPEHDSESDDDNEDVGKKKRTLKKDEREWESVTTIKKGEEAAWAPASAGMTVRGLACTQFPRN